MTRMWVLSADCKDRLPSISLIAATQNVFFKAVFSFFYQTGIN